MLINPKTAINAGWIKFPEWMTEEQRNKCVQPNAIDISLDRLYKIESRDGAFLSETGKQFHHTVELPPDAEGFWTLEPGGVYDGMSDFYVTIPEKVAGELIIRSTLNRLGIALNAGIYDSLFQGNVGMALFNRMAGPLKLKQHTRVCQLKLIMSDSEGGYAGQYNTAQGQHWTEK